MMLHVSDAWFAHKNYGIGTGMPIRWQGWALIAAHLALTLVGLPWAKTNFGGSRSRADTIAAVSAMIASIKPSVLPDAAQFDDRPAGREVW